MCSQVAHAKSPQSQRPRPSRWPPTLVHGSSPELRLRPPRAFHRGQRCPLSCVGGPFTALNLELL
jgi:hypothetical protein